MPQRTDIEWTDFSSNPLKLKLHKSGKLVNACVRCSPGCQSCYAESITRRYWPKEEGDFPGYTAKLMKLGDVVLNDIELQKILRLRPKPPFRNGHTPMMFVEDMSDLAGEFVPFELLDRMFAVAALRPDIIFQFLTKRPERMAEYCAILMRRGILALAASERFGTEIRIPESFPLPNVWIGTSVEDQQRADERIPHLLRCPAAVRFLSCEPLLGAIKLCDINGALASWRTVGCIDAVNEGGIHWIIVGGESGPGARPCNVEWVRSIVGQCKSAGVPCFIKQLGSMPVISTAEDWTEGGYESVDVRLDFPAPYFGGLKLMDRKGGDPNEWPTDLRVHEFPAPAVPA